MNSMWDALRREAPATELRPAAHVQDKNVPKALTILWAICLDNREFACSEIIELSLRIRHWMRIERGRSGMNRTFASWRQRSPQKLKAMIDCLNRPEAETLFALHGASAALAELRLGLDEIVAGERAEVAFAGRPIAAGAGLPERTAEDVHSVP